MKSLGRIELYPIFCEGIFRDPVDDQFILLFGSFGLKRFAVLNLFIRIDMDSA